MFRRQIVIFCVDTLLALLVFLGCRYVASGEFPRWYWLVSSSLFWSGLGIATQKLAFEKFRRIRYAIKAIILIDLLAYVPLWLLWCYAFPEKDITLHQLWPLPLLIAVEVWFYFLFRRLVLRKIPYLYEEIIYNDLAERGIERGAQLEEQTSPLPHDVMQIHSHIKQLSWRDAYQWIEQHRGEFAPDTILTETNDPEEIVAHPERNPRFIFALQPLNNARHLNTVLAFANYKLVEGGVLSVHCETSGMRKERILASNPMGINRLIYFLDFFWTRICPKLRLTRGLYMYLSGAKDRSFPRVEILGRICRAGFQIIDDEVRQGHFYATAVKVSAPIRNGNPSYGPLVRLQRRGKDGKMISVYKFRTMYAYSEFLQAYVYQRVGLQDGGKLNNDFRVNWAGKWLRACWLDELPMIYNWIKGDLKLVGVRPLSRQYFSLYTPEMQALRVTVKPGLFPPFYYERETPKTIEDVQESERRYILAYRQSPLLTDIRYFFGSIYNILIRRKHSH